MADNKVVGPDGRVAGEYCDFCLDEECDFVVQSPINLENYDDLVAGWIDKDEKHIMWLLCASCAVSATMVTIIDGSDALDKAIAQVVDRITRSWTAHGMIPDNLRNSGRATLLHIKEGFKLLEFHGEGLREVDMDSWLKRMDDVYDELVARGVAPSAEPRFSGP